MITMRSLYCLLSPPPTHTHSHPAGDPDWFEGVYGAASQERLAGQRVTHSYALSDKDSLIGQLCPGLRLCLAAEVATGLMCDRWGGGVTGGEEGVFLGGG
jgi:hypothetical protein